MSSLEETEPILVESELAEYSRVCKNLPEICLFLDYTFNLFLA